MLPEDGLRQVLGARERAEAALSDSQDRYRDIFNAVADVMVLRDENFRVVDVNAAFVEQTGFSREEALGEERVLGGTTEPEETIRERHLRVLAGEPVVVETERVRKDGSRVAVELRCIPFRHRGRPHVLYILRDISARKRAEDALRASEEQYRSIFNAAQDWMVLRDADFRVVDINAAYLAVIGCTREEVLGRDKVLGHDPEEALDRLLKSRHAAVLAGEPMVVETRRSRSDGRCFDLELRGVPMQYRGRPHVLYIGRDITERKRAEEALRVSEEQYRSIFNAAQDSMVLRDADFRIVDVNPAYTVLTGYSREEVLGRDTVTTSPPETERSIKALHRHALGGKPIVIEAQHTRKDGTRVDLELRGVAVRHQGKPHVLYIGRDISERKRAEEALRVSEEQYRSIFNASQDTMVLRDADFRVVDVNAAYVAVTGFSREESLGQDRILGNDPPEFERFLKAQHHKVILGQTITLEAERVRRDGRREMRELRAVPVQHRGRPHALYIGRDIDGRKRAEAELLASEEQYRSIFNASSDALVLRDAEARVVDVNPAFLAMTGYSREEVVNQTRWFFAGTEMSEVATAMHARVIAGESVHGELRGTRKDGSLVEVEIHAVPMHYRGNLHVLAMAREITERKRAEAERAQLEAQLRQAQKMEAIGHLAGGIAHDFNNILTSIQGYARLAAELPAATGNPKLASHLDHVELACNRARELIQQMLVFSRGRRGAARAVTLAPLVRQAIRLLRSSLPATLEIVPEFATDLPAALLDPVQAEQVLMNLCINAHDAMHGRGTVQVGLAQKRFDGSVCASCRGAVSGQFVELSVTDEGPGIAPEVMERMFEPFFSTKETGRGTGMGLAIVHGIVHEHGGHILVDSSAGGARFRLLFPAVSGPEAPEGPSPRRATVPAPRLTGRVLLVDDERMVARFMRELLEGWGLHVTALTSATEARHAFTRAPQDYDLLLADYTMPRMTGLDLAQALRALRPALPVILYSGYTDAIPESELERTAVELVQKPIDPDVLLAALRKHL